MHVILLILDKHKLCSTLMLNKFNVYLQPVQILLSSPIQRPCTGTQFSAKTGPGPEFAGPVCRANLCRGDQTRSVQSSVGGLSNSTQSE